MAKFRIPGINIDIEEEEDESNIIYRRIPHSEGVLKINKLTGEILNRKTDTDHKTKARQIAQNNEQKHNLNNDNVGVKYEQKFDVGGYDVEHTHYNDDSQVYKVYKHGKYIGTAYSTQDLYDMINEDKNKGDD